MNDVLKRYGSLRNAIAASFSPTTQECVDKALVFAEQRMREYTRYDGTPLFDHDVAVAEIVAKEIGLGRNSTVAAILHDIMRIVSKERPEEVESLSRTIREEFGEPVLGIIVGLCKISNIKLKVSKEQADDFRDMIVSYSEDPRVILIKLADRLEVMRNLNIFPPDKRRKKSWESLNLYAQIAHKLGLYALKSELEDLALKWLENKDYEYICRRLEETESERQTFIARFLQPIEERLKQVPNLNYHIKSRTKSVYSIWNKMRKQNVGFEGVYDIFALRVIIDCPKELEKQLCWTVYSVVSDCYTPNPKRMRD
ncbi:MAG: bifunctional (p)ppGpp synthetase/guanosine-3',5'-bis(diphosphate) 3'-pyrophosphohydrolase, partial [Alistipes sp.]|nr:bifunctional (p)ppGpp synthetase/guanosine-3',5'-bis(diphosphate) 3'-pyrophosphohydrolase [Alistipes sp.]